MQSDFEWMRILWMVLILGSLFAVPVLTFWWDGRKERQQAERADQSANA